jgi:hypothetical protein
MQVDVGIFHVSHFRAFSIALSQQDGTAPLSMTASFRLDSCRGMTVIIPGSLRYMLDKFSTEAI